MDKSQILVALKKARESKKRNFAQGFDLAVSLKDFDTNKEKVEDFVKLPKGRGKTLKICALVGPEMKNAVEKYCDLTITTDSFNEYENSRKVRKLARDYDHFVAQANLMAQIAKTFGKYLGSIGKMPNPKGGQIIAPKANIEHLVKNLKDTIRITAKKSPAINCPVGNENMSDDDVAENILSIIDKLNTTLPRGASNISKVYIKTTMGGPIKI
jgi:large subunit ribosomal protein L1